MKNIDNNFNISIKQKQNIKVLVLDVDGTLTDGKIYMGKDGEVFKAFDIKDGCGIHDILPQYNIIPIVITARSSDIVTNRCRELNISHYYQGCRDKLGKIKELASKFNFDLNMEGVYENIAYIGDDIIDIPCMKYCSIIACPNDAVEDVKSIAHFISSQNGGNGAVREFIDWLIK